MAVNNRNTPTIAIVPKTHIGTASTSHRARALGVKTWAALTSSKSAQPPSMSGLLQRVNF